ncbi:MAG: hypothetical protein DRR06_07705 [Gammaproteobacteria bacterium]|nr:MAG: hypothetical protein DRR06_07705 [Gammaproteobacteria bacterium]RLA51922.1 MAG: hypothetical protein DRR42_08940 [Gammaproteobacteria bacterium]
MSAIGCLCLFPEWLNTVFEATTGLANHIPCSDKNHFFNTRSGSDFAGKCELDAIFILSDFADESVDAVLIEPGFGIEVTLITKMGSRLVDD